MRTPVVWSWLEVVGTGRPGEWRVRVLIGTIGVIIWRDDWYPRGVATIGLVRRSSRRWVGSVWKLRVTSVGCWWTRGWAWMRWGCSSRGVWVEAWLMPALWVLVLLVLRREPLWW